VLRPSHASLLPADGLCFVLTLMRGLLLATAVVLY
jgi:hypothetical protein